MRVYLIKHKGASILRNMYFDRNFTFTDGDKFVVGLLFFRKNHALKYLETLDNKEFFEVVGATVDKVEQDNRKRK